MRADVLSGYNEAIDYGGLRFHVQTEHRRSANSQQIVSHLFFNGCVVSSRKSIPERRASGSGDELRRQMQSQHAELIRSLAGGALDREIEATPGTGEFRPVHAAVVPPEHSWESDRGQQFAEGLHLLRQAETTWQKVAQNPQASLAYTRCASALQKLVQVAEQALVQHGANAHGEVATAASSNEENKLIEQYHRQVSAANHFKNGLLLLQQRKYRSVLEEWQAALRLDPENSIYRRYFHILRQRLTTTSQGSTRSN